MSFRTKVAAASCLFVAVYLTVELLIVFTL